MSILFGALASPGLIEYRARWYIKRFGRTARSYRTMEIRTGKYIVTAEDPVANDLRGALALIISPRWALT